MDAGPSFASRRPAATGLPAFSLPPPDIPSTKYPASASFPTASSLSTFSTGPNQTALSPLSSSTSTQPALLALPRHTLPAPVSSVLTPPSGVANDGLSPLSSGVNTGSSMSSQPGTTAGPTAANYSYMSGGGSWPTPQHPSGGSYTNTGSYNNAQSPLLNQPFPNARSMYQQVSPSIPQFPQSSGRHSIPDGLPPPAPYHQSSPVFLTPISGLGGGGGGGANTGSHHISHSQGPSQNQTTPTSAGAPDGSFRSHQQQQQQYHQQQQNQHQQQQQQQQQRQQRTPLPGHEVSQQQQQQPQHGLQYPYRTTPQQQSFPTFPSNNPQQQQQSSPTTRSPPTQSNELVLRRGIRNPMDAGGSHPGSGSMGVMQGFGSGRQGPGMSFGYQMSASGGPIMTNMHQPGTPMAVVGNVGSMMPGGYNPGGGGPHGLHVYGQGHHQQIHQDRPFKCDQCQQSFNRNHDLKRHKRIHMAIKPFPCTFCEKAFSRKDALKRHRLVKGCGERMKAGEDKGEDSPPDRSDIMSDTTEDSPRVTKRETM